MIKEKKIGKHNNKKRYTLILCVVLAAIDFGKGQIRLANIEKKIISGALFDDAQILPRLPIPSNPMVLDEVQMKEETQDEDVPDLESNDKEGQVMRIMEMDEETFIWTKLGTYIPPNTTTFVQAVVWPEKDWTKGPIVVKEMGKHTLFKIEASILDAKNKEFRILLINDTNDQNDWYESFTNDQEYKESEEEKDTAHGGSKYGDAYESSDTDLNSANENGVEIEDNNADEVEYNDYSDKK
uniref:Uncharacterized protein n=1 Tax=Romanomermis culicivorax TaxID=13658 RepID=A0A915KH71_ROMCU